MTPDLNKSSPAAALSAQALERVRRNNPDFDRDHAVIEVALRDCAIAYWWNPIVATHEFESAGPGPKMYAGVDESTRIAWIVFRGTASLLDLAIDLSFVPLPFTGHPSAHGGFVLSWKLAKLQFASWLREHASRFDRVFVSGHSLGGALAVACTYDLLKEGYDVDRCVTVGMPRLYTAWSVKQAEAVVGSRLLRVIKKSDFVPKVPPELLGFRHFGDPWVYVKDLLGQAEPEPLPQLTRWLDVAWYWVRGGPVAGWMERLTGVNMDAQLVVYLLVLVSSLGGGFAVLANAVQASVWSLFAGTLLFLLMSGALVAYSAHLSGRYAATRKAANLVEEWQLHYLRQLVKDQTPEPLGNDQVAINISTVIAAHHDDDCKRRLIRNFRRFFGKATFNTMLGRTLEEALASEAGGRSRSIRRLPLDTQLKGVCTALRLFGYSSEEVDAMLTDGVIRRPRGWTRYYCRVKVSEPPAAPGAGPDHA